MSSATASEATSSCCPDRSKRQGKVNDLESPGKICPTAARQISLPSSASATSPGENASEPELATVTEKSSGRSMPTMRREGVTAAMATFLTWPGPSSTRQITGTRRGKREKIRSTRPHSALSETRQPQACPSPKIITSLAGLLPAARTCPAAAIVRGASIVSSRTLILSSNSRISRLEEIGEAVRISGRRSPTTRPNAVPLGERRTSSAASESARSIAERPEASLRRIEAEISMTTTTSLSMPLAPKRWISGKNGRAKAKAARMMTSVRNTSSNISSTKSLRRRRASDCLRNIHAPHSTRRAVRR